MKKDKEEANKEEASVDENKGFELVPAPVERPEKALYYEALFNQEGGN